MGRLPILLFKKYLYFMQINNAIVINVRINNSLKMDALKINNTIAIAGTIAVVVGGFDFELDFGLS